MIDFFDGEYQNRGQLSDTLMRLTIMVGNINDAVTQLFYEDDKVDVVDNNNGRGANLSP